MVEVNVFNLHIHVYLCIVSKFVLSNSYNEKKIMVNEFSQVNLINYEILLTTQHYCLGSTQ